jgi:translation initiation factor IF-3
LSDLIINESIRSRTVKLVEEDRLVGILALHDALSRARKAGLDLVIMQEGDPPLCKILDADKFRFEKKKADRELAKRQRAMTIETKEIQLRPVTDVNDVSTKAKHARRFLEDGNRVRIIVKFKGRERTHKDWGRDMIDRFLIEVGEHKIDKPLSEGDSDLTIILASVVSKSDLMNKKATCSELQT